MDYKSHLRESMKLTDREVGAFGKLFLREVLRFAASTDVVSEFLEGGFGGWHPQTLTECGLSDHGL